MLDTQQLTPDDIPMITDKSVICLKEKMCTTKEEEDKRKKNHAALAKRMVALYDQLAANLLGILQMYREWKLEAMFQNKINREHEMEFVEISLSTMPVTIVAVYLVPLLDIQHWFDPGLQDPEQSDMLKSVVKEWLSQVDNVIHSRVSSQRNPSKDADGLGTGSLSALYMDDKKCAAMAELLMLNKIWPSRIDILLNTTNEALEQGSIPGFGIRPGSLREKVVLGQMDLLAAPVDMFLDVLEIGLSKEISFEMPALAKTMKVYTHLIFDFVDLNGDGLLSQEESAEFCRVLLSRASLGRLLITCICEYAADDLIRPTTTPVTRTSLISIIPSLLLTFASEGVELLALNLWLDMDFDGNGELIKAEFCEHFPRAFWKIILLPLIGRLAEKSGKLNAAHTTKNKEWQKDGSIKDGSTRDCTFSRDCTCLSEHLFPKPLTNKHIAVDSNAKHSDEFAQRDYNSQYREGILFSSDEEGYLVSENLNVDEAALKGSSNSSCRTTCYNGMPKRACLPKRPCNDALEQPCSDTLDASCGNAPESKNAACNVM